MLAVSIRLCNLQAALVWLGVPEHVTTLLRVTTKTSYSGIQL